MVPTFDSQRRRQSSVESARKRAPRSFFTAGGTVSAAAVTVPGRGEYGKTCTFVIPAARTTVERALEGCVVLAGKPDDHVGREIEARERLDLGEVLRDRVPPSHRPQHAVVARLERDVQVSRGAIGLHESFDEIRAQMIDLDRGQSKTLDSR